MTWSFEEVGRFRRKHPQMLHKHKLRDTLHELSHELSESWMVVFDGHTTLTFQTTIRSLILDFSPLSR